MSNASLNTIVTISLQQGLAERSNNSAVERLFLTAGDIQNMPLHRVICSL